MTRATMRRGPEPEEWYVTRHGGRRPDNWRVVFISTDRDKALAAYEADAAALRQGGVQLWKPAGDYHVMVAETWAPRCRTRW